MQDELNLKKDLKAVDKVAGELVIQTAEDYKVAGEFLVRIDDMMKKVVEYWKEPKEKAFQAHKAIVAKEKEMLDPLKDRKSRVNSIMSAWALKVKQEREAEQRRIDEERRKAEEAERRKLEKAAEKAEAKGNSEKADELREKAEDVYIPPVSVEPVIDKTVDVGRGSITQVNDISLEVDNPIEILKLVVEGKLPADVVNINTTKLKRIVKEMKWTKLPGCRISETMRQSIRR
jgi:hypothetical protein